MKKLFLFLFIISVTTLTAQEYKSFSIANISEKEVWPAVYQTFKELKLPRPYVNKTINSGETGYYNYTALFIKNRCKFILEFAEGTLTVGVTGRQYLSDGGWVDNFMPMSKKQASKLLKPIEKSITTLTKNSPYEADQVIVTIETTANKTTGQSTAQLSKKGIYDDFVIVRTEDPDMDLLAIHKNGSIIGYSLSDNEKNVKVLVFKENNDAEAIILEFDEKGLPTYMKTQNLVIKINANNSGELNLFIKDSAGNYIGEQQVAINDLPIQTSVDEFYDNNTNHGPYFETAVTTLDLSLSDWLGYSSYALSQIANGLGKKVVSSIAIEFGKSLSVTLADPENKFFLNEISTCVPIVATAITPFVQAALVLPVTAASMSTVAALGVIVGGLKISYDAWMRLKERHWPTPQLSLAGFNSVITGSFGEWGKEPTILRAESNYPNVEIHWEVASSDLAIKSISMGDKNYTPNCSSIEVYAKETNDPLLYIDAFQIIDNEEIRKRMNFTIVAPGYYYMPYPNCSKLHDLGIITDEQYEQCSIQEELCKNEIWDSNGEILENDPEILKAILNEHLLSSSGLTDQAQSIKSQKLNFIRKIWKKDGTPYPPEEAGELRDFVKPAHCMAKWFGFQDRDSIILLAHEAMDKIQGINDKIEGLQKVVNDKNYIKIGMDIKKLEDSIEPIRKEYGDKINAIAEKGTIQIETKMTDPAQYYRINSVKLVGAHWENRWLDILIGVDLVKTPIPKTINDEQFYETVGDIRFNYIDKEGQIIQKGTALFTKFAMPFETFEKIDLIDFNSSLSVLRKKISKDGLDTFGN